VGATLHELEQALLTDSGGFQVFSLAKLRKVTDDASSSARTWTAACTSSRRAFDGGADRAGRT